MKLTKIFASTDSKDNNINKPKITKNRSTKKELFKKEQILALSDDVKKYFKASNWAFYKDEECKDNHVLLCKSIYKDMDFQVLVKAVDITRNNEKIRTTKYTIGKITINL